MKISLFGDGKCLEGSTQYKLAFEIGRLIASKGISIVNGGYGGVMEASFKGASLYSVERIAIITQQYKNFISPNATQIIITNSYLERLSKLLETGEMYVFLEGGSGTLLELIAYFALWERDLLEKQAIFIGNNWKENFSTLTSKFSVDIPFHLITIFEDLEEFKINFEKLFIY